MPDIVTTAALAVETRAAVERLTSVAQKVIDRRNEPLKERVAVPNPKGGYYMEVRVIKQPR